MRSDFVKTIGKVIALEENSRYLGAYVFGSVARGEETDESDIDVKVIVDKGDCQNISHPFIDGKKFDITFMTFEQQEDMLNRQAKKGERVPMIAESIILFDKTGKLKKLKKKFGNIKPKKLAKADYKSAQFWVYHADNKIARAMRKKDFLSAQLGMHLNLKDILKIYYEIKGKWWTSDKRMFADLRKWDKGLARLLVVYLRQDDIQKKHKYWSKIVGYILKPIGGRKDIKEINCTCIYCKRDLANLLKS